MQKLNKIIFAFTTAAALIITSLTSASAESFTLREYNGRVALFGEDGEQLCVYQTPISSFYPADRAFLENGIVLNSREELRRLIEDLDLN